MMRSGGGLMGMKSIQPSGFRPTEISGLAVWFNFADLESMWTDTNGTTQVASDGDLIARIDDKSGNGNELTQATSDARPTYKTAIKNGLSVGRFDGVDDTLVQASGDDIAQPFTAFMGINNTRVATGSNDRIMMDTGGTTQFYRSVGKWAIFAGTGVVSNALTGVDWDYVTGLFDGASSEVWIDGTSTATGDAGATAMQMLHLGANTVGTEPFTGDIGEIMVYDSGLSDADRLRVEDYLSKRWGS